MRDAEQYIRKILMAKRIVVVRVRKIVKMRKMRIEAIRPTNIQHTPESIKNYLTNDQYKLYKLIYARTLASLIAPSKSNVVNAIIVERGLRG